MEDGCFDMILETDRGKYYQNGECDWIGFGDINAANAVKVASKSQPVNQK